MTVVDLNRLFRKATDFARKNPDAVRSGVGKVSDAINSRTGGKCSDQVAKGGAAIDKALGVPGRAKDAYRDEASAPGEPTEPVRTDPIDPPEDIERPRPV